MDDRDQSWRFAYDESSGDKSDDESWPRSSGRDKRLSELLDKDETAIARRMEAIDAAVQNLREFSGGKLHPRPVAAAEARADGETARVTQPERAPSTSVLRQDAPARSPDVAARLPGASDSRPDPFPSKPAAQPVKSEPVARPSEAELLARRDAHSAGKLEMPRPSDISARPASSTTVDRREQVRTSAGPEPGKPAQRTEPATSSLTKAAESPRDLSRGANPRMPGVASMREQPGPAGDSGPVKPAEARVASPSNQQAAPSAERSEIAKPTNATGQSQSDAKAERIERTSPVASTRSAEPLEKQDGNKRIDAPASKVVPDSARVPQASASRPDGAGAKPAGEEKPSKPTTTNGSPSGIASPGLARDADKPAPAAGSAPAADVNAEASPNRPQMRIDGEMKDNPKPSGMVTLEGDRGPIEARPQSPAGPPPSGGDNGRGGGGGGGGGIFHRRLGPIEFGSSLTAGLKAVKRNLAIVLVFTFAGNVLVLAIPVYLFQISDRILTSRSEETLIMLTIVVVGAVVLQAVFDAVRRYILMRTAVEVAAQLGAPILGAAARASLNSNGKEYQTLGDLQQLRTFLTSGTLLSLLDAPMVPFFLLAVFLIHPHLGSIVVAASLVLLVITLINQRLTAKPFSEANAALSKANLHLDSMTRNSQIINALAMIPEAVRIWGRDTADSLRAQVVAQDRNITCASLSKAVRLLTQVALLGWGAYLAIGEQLTGGMVIAGSIIAGRALNPIEGAIEGWNQVVQSRSAYDRIAALLRASPLNLERLNLPRPEGRLDVERLLYVPQGTKRVVLNGISFALNPGDSLAVIGNSGAGKTTLGKMLVGSILPTSGNVRLDLMDLRNWDQRQFGESIGYLPQDVQLFPASIKANIARMRDDATDAQIYEAAKLADVHEMIATLPHGYETLVAADGAPLSGGQKQRVALARAFFGNPRLVVLDEPNSNLDAAGDAALAQALQHAKEQKITVITITQRPALLRSVDKILLLVSGAVALFGVRQDVLQALAQRGLSIEGGSFGHQLP